MSESIRAEVLAAIRADSACDPYESDAILNVILAEFVVIRPPTVGHLAPHETVASRYRTAASEVRGNRRGWGSNMRESIARTLDAISDAMEGQG